MKKLLLAAALCLSSSAAIADATFTISLTGAGASNASKTMVVSDADAARIIAWAKDVGGPVTVLPATTDPAICNSPLSIPPTAACFPTTRTMTNKEAIESVFDSAFRAIREGTIARDRERTRKTAEDAVAPIAPK